MPCDYRLYPKNWKSEIRPAILERDGNRCHECKAENHSVGYWGKDGHFWTADEILTELENTGRDLFDEKDVLGHIPGDKKPIKIVLTISHTDHDISNNDYSNLKALCQKHHLAHDQNHHLKNAKETNRKKKGLQNLF